MTIPGFTAARSLEPAVGRYAGPTAAIAPAVPCPRSATCVAPSRLAGAGIQGAMTCNPECMYGCVRACEFQCCQVGGGALLGGGWLA